MTSHELDRARAALAALPRGTIQVAVQAWRRAEAAVGNPAVDDAAAASRMAELLVAPLLLDATWPQPTEPTPVDGGWVHADVIDDDLDVLNATLERWRSEGPEAVAGAAQEMRLPVLPYRPLLVRGSPGAADRRGTAAVSVATPGSVRPAASLGTDQASLAGRLVIDLSTHWAGPLATALLAGAGATVIKIDPDARPDGFRPRAALYDHLNGAKQVRDLDLRRAVDRSEFERLVAGAQLVVESFSERVMSNLGYGRGTLGAPVLSIRAFPRCSPERAWLAYGPGVHAVSGLGYRAPDLTPAPAPVAYPDVLAGLTAFGRAAEILTGSGPAAADAEVSLGAAIEPLRRLAAA